ncbi:MAG: LysR family transcriptional regulator [Pseudomonadota bacterium]
MIQSAIRDLDIPLLRTFLAVAETGGMTPAARQLNLTQAAVSQQIKRLEQTLDVPLFDRTQRQIRLTATGERLIGYAHQMLALNREVWSVMTSPDFEGEVTLGVPHDLVASFVPTILREFARTWPRVNVMLNVQSTSLLLEGLAAGQVDLTLTTETEPAGEVLMVDTLVWAGAISGEAHRQDVVPVALGAATCMFRHTAAEALRAAGRDWRLNCQGNTMEPAIALIEADMAVGPFLRTVLPERLAELGPDAGLPPLCDYYVNLHRAPVKENMLVDALAETIVRRLQRSATRVAA